MVSIRRSENGVEAHWPRRVVPVARQFLATSPHEVEAMLIEAWHLWRRSPGGGRWPYAGDAPWHLMQRDVLAGDYDARGGDGVAPPVRLGALSVAEVDRRDQVSGWLSLVGERDRRLVAVVIDQMARRRSSQPDFMALRAMFPNRHGAPIGADGLRKRYDRALSAIVRALCPASVMTIPR